MLIVLPAAFVSRPPTDTALVSPQTKRYDEVFTREAVENWIKTRPPGTHERRT